MGIMFFIMTVVLGKSNSVLGKAATNNSLSRHLGFGGHSPRGQNRGTERESERDLTRRKKKEKEIHRDIERVVSRGTTTYYIELRREALAAEYRLQ
jgi:hypothetical protein